MSQAAPIEQAGALEPIPTADDPLNVSEISVPLNLGEIRDRFVGTNGKTIIHIQDAHCNYAAQNSIEGIIGSITATHGNVDLLSLEGGTGDYDLSLFTGITDPGVREKVSDYFVREGRVSGAEFFAINNPERLKVFGIEDESLYMGNLNTYRSSLPSREEADRNIDRLSAMIDSFKQKVYTEPLKELDGAITAFSTGKTGLKDHVKFLVSGAQGAKLDMAPYGAVKAMISLLEDEKLIDFKEAGKERQRLIDQINAKVSKTYMEDMALKSVRLSKGEISSEEFYSELFRMAKFSDVDFSSMPNLVKYSEYVAKFDGIDKRSVFREVEDMEDALAGVYSVTEDQRTLYSLDKKLKIVRDMSEASLVKDEFDRYMADKDSFGTKSFLDFFKTRGPVYGINFDLGGEIGMLDGYLEEMEKFYSYSLERDKAFIVNIEKKMEEGGDDVTILVTGGFHTSNLAGLFKEKGYSYVGIMPKFNESDVPNRYFQLLAGQKTDLEKMLAKATTPEGSTIAVQTIFSKMKLDENDKAMQKLKKELLQAVYEAELRGEDLSVPVLVGEPGEDTFLVTFVRITPDTPQENVIRLSGDIGVTFSAENVTGEGLLRAPMLVLRKGLNVSLLNSEDLDAQNILIDGPGIAVGKTRFEDMAQAVAEIRAVLRDRYGFSEGEINALLGQTGMHNIFMWDRPMTLFSAEILGHIGKREAQDVKGEKVARGEAARADLAQYGVVYLSPVLFANEASEEPYQDFIIGLLHEVGEMYGMSHGEVLDPKKAAKMTKEELAAYAKEVTGRISEENRIKVPGGTAMAAWQAPEELLDVEKKLEDIKYRILLLDNILKSSETALAELRKGGAVSAAEEERIRQLERGIAERNAQLDQLGKEAERLVAESDRIFQASYPGTAMARENVPKRGKEDRLQKYSKTLAAAIAKIPARDRTDPGYPARLLAKQRMSPAEKELRKLLEERPYDARAFFTRDVDRDLIDSVNERGRDMYRRIGVDETGKRRMTLAQLKARAEAYAQTGEKRSRMMVDEDENGQVARIIVESDYDSVDYRPRETDFFSEAVGARIADFDAEAIEKDNQAKQEAKAAYEKDWKSWLDRVGGYGEETLSGVYPDLFDGEKSAIAIGISPEEWAHKSTLDGVKAGAMGVLRKEVSKDMVIFYYLATDRGVTALENQLKEHFGVEDLGGVKSRIAATATTREMTEESVAKLEGISYKVVKIHGEVEGFPPTVTPVGACVFECLALLNKSHLEEKEKAGKKVSDFEKNKAVQLVLKGIMIISGGMADPAAMEELAERIRAQGYSLEGIDLVVKIRPINLEEIADFHKSDTAVLRSL